MEIKGLTEQKASELQKKFGKNILPEKSSLSNIALIINQIKNPLIYILFGTGFVSILFGEYFDAVLIISVVILNVIMGFYQEKKAQNAIKALKQMLNPKAFILRENQKYKINISEIVPGDIIYLSKGDLIPADGVLLEGNDLIINEAILTGESEAVTKNPKKSNVLFMGTFVLSGNGIMKVDKTGISTQMGKIGKGLVEIESGETPIQKKLKEFAKSLSKIILLLGGIILLIGIFRGIELREIIRLSAVLAIAAIPEGLPIAVTVILSLGAKRILSKKGLVKSLMSVETLGVTSIICTDKTGTLTEGKMTVKKFEVFNKEKAFTGITINNMRKSNFDVCLWEYTNLKSPSTLKSIKKAEKILEKPFDQELKYSLNVFKINKQTNAFIIGAPEIVLNLCDISNSQKKIELEKIKKLATEGFRIIGLAYSENWQDKNTKYIWNGIIGISDPIRIDAKKYLLEAVKAGIEVKIVTGDYLETAVSVAKNIGMEFNKNQVITGQQLDNLSDTELEKRILNFKVFARVNPHQKLKIVTFLQKQGEIIAMNGDGVNDSLALKKADIGVVMGDSSDVAKGTADLILLDNNFSTIVEACEQGRLIYENIPKVISYILSNSFVEIVVILGSIFLNLPLPLTIAQILWLHLICDGPPDIVLSFEPPTSSLLRKNPREIRRKPILGSITKWIILAVTLSAGLISLINFSIFQ